MPSNLFGAKGPAKPHLVRGKGGLSGEIVDIRADIEEAFSTLENGGGLMEVVEWTDLVAADPNAIKLSIASAAGVETYVGAALDGVIGVLEMVPPRNVDITTTAHADIDAVAVVVTGTVRNKLGALIAQTDTITLTDGGNVTDAGIKAFSFVTSVVIPTQGGTGGALTIGFGDLVGMPTAIKTRAGLTAPLREVEAGSVVTTGTFTTAAADAPYGTYLPGTVADAANDYALTYEVDPAV